MVRPAYPDQKKDPAAFWRALAEDGKQTRILEIGEAEKAIGTANERLESCKIALPQPSKAHTEVMP